MNASSKRRVAVGELPASESLYAWKARSEDPWPSTAEMRAAEDSLRQFLASWYVCVVAFRAGDATRGYQLSIDSDPNPKLGRSLVLHASDTEVIELRLMERVQQWLGLAKCSWRVVFITGDAVDAVVVYATKVLMNPAITLSLAEYLHRVRDVRLEARYIHNTLERRSYDFE